MQPFVIYNLLLLFRDGTCSPITPILDAQITFFPPSTSLNKDLSSHPTSNSTCFFHFLTSSSELTSCSLGGSLDWRVIPRLPTISNIPFFRLIRNGQMKWERTKQHTTLFNNPHTSEILHSETDPNGLQTDLIDDRKLIFFEFLIGIGSDGACGDVWPDGCFTTD